MSNIGKEGGWGECAEVGGDSSGVALSIFATTLVGWLFHCRHGCFALFWFRVVILRVIAGVSKCVTLICVLTLKAICHIK